MPKVYHKKILEKFTRKLCLRSNTSKPKKLFYKNSTVAIGNPERHVRKASHRGSKQQ